MKDTWSVDTSARMITGEGKIFDFNRKVKNEGLITLSFDSVAVYETNLNIEHTETLRVISLVVISGLAIIVTTIIIACGGWQII